MANRDGTDMVMVRELSELTFGGLRWSPDTAGDACVVWTNDVDEFGVGNLVISRVDNENGEPFALTTVGRGYDWFPHWHPDAVCAAEK